MCLVAMCSVVACCSVTPQLSNSCNPFSTLYQLECWLQMFSVLYGSSIFFMGDIYYLMSLSFSDTSILNVHFTSLSSDVILYSHFRWIICCWWWAIYNKDQEQMISRFPERYWILVTLPTIIRHVCTGSGLLCASNIIKEKQTLYICKLLQL